MLAIFSNSISFISCVCVHYWLVMPLVCVLVPSRLYVYVYRFVPLSLSLSLCGACMCVCSHGISIHYSVILIMIITNTPFVDCLHVQLLTCFMLEYAH